MDRRSPLLAVDVIILRSGKLVLIKRGKDPYKGKLALPGGFVEYGESVEEAARREAKEETGLEVELKKIVGVYSDPNRDPRGHVVSICFLANGKGEVTPGSDASEVIELDPRKVNRDDLAFDHWHMLRDSGVI